MPDKAMYDLLNNFEEALLLELKDTDGYLNIGRQTGNDTREIYFACCEFRKSSKIVHNLSQKYSAQLNVKYSIYKDKYWQSYERFRMH